MYGDWLQLRGDPRGALIAAHAQGDVQAAEGLLREHAEEFLGPFAPGAELASSVALGWGLGFWRRAVLCHHDGDDLDELVRRVLEHPSARFLEQLVVRSGDEEPASVGRLPLRSAIEALLQRGPLPSLRAVALGDRPEGHSSDVPVGELGGLWSIAPRLERLEVSGRAILLTRFSERLRWLALHTAGLPRATLVGLGRARLPALQHLDLCLGAAVYGGTCTDVDLARLLAGDGLHSLRWLGLRNSELLDELPTLLAAGPLLQRLEVLDLSHGILTDAGACELIEWWRRFAHLEQL
ncbi:MAG TPA: hypothetical protein ENK18_16880, partial [Deltaproteobacteria bacterium]|nr:hypothetical protein [Deltaproteobacteria bacterium]